METNWLYPFINNCVEHFSDAKAQQRLDQFGQSNPELDTKMFIRRYLEHRLRERGVVYGTPLASELTITQHTEPGFHQRQAVFLALQQVQLQLAMEVGVAISHHSQGSLRSAELLVCYALYCRSFRTASQIHNLLPKLVASTQDPPQLVKLARQVAKKLADRAYLAGNPLLGLPMHNSFSYTDAKTFCRLAVAYFEKGRPDREATQRVFDYQDRERKLLLEAFLGLTQADRPIGMRSRKVMIEQIRLTKLPRPVRKDLLAILKQPRSSLAVAAAVQDDRTRDFLLEQVLLGAILDGHVSQNERDYIQDLASWLGVSQEELRHVEAQVLAFYDEHQAYLDLFTVRSAVRFHRQRLLDRLQSTIAENLNLIVQEIKSKSDLGELLYRASMGEKLDRQEWKKVRRQLLDILRSIPSLAIFSLPFGVILLPLVYKLLPDGLKPRTFAEHEKSKKETKTPFEF